jgi:hypothetical protein
MPFHDGRTYQREGSRQRGKASPSLFSKLRSATFGIGCSGKITAPFATGAVKRSKLDSTIDGAWSEIRRLVSNNLARFAGLYAGGAARAV